MSKALIRPQARPTVEEVHFLIHPGYGETMLYQRLPGRFQAMFRSWIEAAITLKSRGLLIAFLHRHSIDYEEDTRRKFHYTECLREIAEQLGDRFVAVHDRTVLAYPNNTIEGLEPLFHARLTAAERGLHFGKNVRSEAYGETLKSCVPTIAHYANIVYELAKKTLVRPERTNWGVNPYRCVQALREDVKPYLEKKYHRIRIEIPCETTEKS